jgi:branched-subunit amino acid transport protein AzlD
MLITKEPCHTCPFLFIFVFRNMSITKQLALLVPAHCFGSFVLLVATCYNQATSSQGTYSFFVLFVLLARPC